MSCADPPFFDARLATEGGLSWMEGTKLDVERVLLWCPPT